MTELNPIGGGQAISKEIDLRKFENVYSNDKTKCFEVREELNNDSMYDLVSEVLPEHFKQALQNLNRKQQDHRGDHKRSNVIQSQDEFPMYDKCSMSENTNNDKSMDDKQMIRNQKCDENYKQTVAFAKYNNDQNCFMFSDLVPSLSSTKSSDSVQYQKKQKIEKRCKKKMHRKLRRVKLLGNAKVEVESLDAQIVF